MLEIIAIIVLLIIGLSMVHNIIQDYVVYYSKEEDDGVYVCLNGKCNRVATIEFNFAEEMEKKAKARGVKK